MRAIDEDTKFLAENAIMDYSLLTCIDDQTGELVVGIIGERSISNGVVGERERELVVGIIGERSISNGVVVESENWWWESLVRGLLVMVW